MIIGQAEITVMVEDFWRSFLPIASTSQPTAALIIERFDKQINNMAALMPPDDAAMFNEMVEQERHRMYEEYRVYPARLKSRLGVQDVTGAGPNV